MDYSTLAGLLVALAGILVGQLLEGGHAGSLLQAAAFLIVFCGTAGAVMVQTQVRVFLEGVRMARWALWRSNADPLDLILRIVDWANLVRREGLLSLESRIRLSVDPFVRKALQLLVDGADASQLRDVLHVEIVGYEERLRRAARIWEAAGGYAPTVGILGAVLGLIHVMENLADPTRLGSGIAVAFVATIYGVGLANLVFLPISNKLKAVISEQVTMREILVDGLMGIANGENPRMIQSKLEGYMQ
ncbi:MAG TPA: flagellar motor protein [Burkholderiales bacterium]|nr:flagellar motor protein [Burkholderiales bacterium]